MTYKVEVILRVVNDRGEVVDYAGHEAVVTHVALSASRTLTQAYDTPARANSALNLVWAFLNPIDNLASRHPDYL